MSTETQPAAEKTTSYYVYTVDPANGVLTPVGEPHQATPATNDLAAIKKVVGDQVGVFAGIPVRNVNYRTRAIETVPKEKWS
jgi:hypothetical protein